MGVQYNGMKLVWLKQSGGKTTTLTWVSPDEGSLGAFAGGQKIAIPVKVRVINGPKPTFSLVAGEMPPGLSLNAENGTINGTPENVTGTFEFTLRATSNAAFIERAFAIALAVNSAPVWVTPAGSLGDPFDSTDYDYLLEATDPEGQPVKYSLVTGSLPGGLKLDADTGEIKGRLRYVNSDTTFFFTVRASDGLASTNESFNITVKANEAPYWITPATNNNLGIFIEGIYTEVQLQARDPENQPLTYSISNGNLPTEITLDPATGLLSGTLGTIDTGKNLTFTAKVTDGNKAAERSFSIALSKNVPPVWSAPTPAFTEVSGYSISFPLLAADPNGKPLTFTSSNLPDGFSIFGGTIIAILPEISEETDYSFDVTASDGLLTADKTIVVRSLVNTPPVWNTPADLGTVRENEPVSIQLSATDPEGKPVTYTATTDLPQGLALAIGGRIVGTPIDVTEDTTFEFSVEVSDGVNTVERDFSLLVQNNVSPVWTTDAGSLGEIVAGYEGNFVFAATDEGDKFVTYALVSGTLPPGMTLDNNRITGFATPATTDETYTFTLSASDGVTTPTERTFSITRKANLPFTWVTPAGRLGEAFEKAPFSFKLETTDPEGKAIRYGVPNGVQGLPGGLSLNSTTGVVSGVLSNVSQDTELNFTIVARIVGESTTVSRSFSVLAKFNTAPEFFGEGQTPFAFDIVEGRASTAKVTARNVGNGPMVYTLASGALPAGLTLQTNGSITGFAPMALTDTTYEFTVLANNGIKTNEQFYSITVIHNLAPVWATNAGSLGSVFAGVNRSFPVAATDANNQTVIYSLISGALPAGLTLHPSTGVISGTPQIGPADVTATFTLRASDGVLSSDRIFSITVLANAKPSWVTAAGSLGEVIRNKSFNIALEAADPENQTLTYSIVQGVLPQGILLNPNTGAIVGRAPDVTSDEDYTVTLRVSDGVLFDDREFTITVTADAAPVWATPAGSLGSVLSGYAGSFGVSATDPDGLEVTISMVSGALPTGWGFDPEDNVIASPEDGAALTTVDQTYSFTLRATDGQVFTDRQFSVTILKNLKPTWTQVYNTNFGERKERTVVDFTVVASDTEGRDITYEITSGALPAGLGLNAMTGQVSGRLGFVQEDEAVAFGISAFDGTQYSDELSYVGAVLFDSPPVWTTPAGTLGSVLEDTDFTRTLVATSNGETVTYSVKFGSTLPGTLSLDPNTGELSGRLPLTSNATDTYSFVIIATNPQEKTSERMFAVTIQDNVAPIWVSAGGLLITDLAGTLFSYVLTASDANGTPITYSVVSGTLPEGVTFDVPTHTLSGILPEVETDTTYSITIGASDGNIRVDRSFSFRSLKDTAPVWQTAASLGDFVEQRAFSTTLSATDSQLKVVRYDLKEGSVLPGTLTLQSVAVTNGQNTVPAGRLSGTLPANEVPGSTDSYSFTVVASDGTLTTEREFTIGVNHNEAPVWQTAAGALGNVVEGQAFTSTLVASDAEGRPVTYALAPDSTLPSGLILNATSGVISGAPTSVAADTLKEFTVRASDDLRYTDRTFSITVLNAVAPVDTFSEDVGLLIQFSNDNSDNTGKTVYSTANSGKIVTQFTNRLVNDINELPAVIIGDVVMSSDTKTGFGSISFPGGTARLEYGGGFSSAQNLYPSQVGPGVVDFTFEGWVRTSSATVQTLFSHMMFLGTNGTQDLGLAVQYRPGVGMIATMGQDNPSVLGPYMTVAGNFADNQWHHVAVTRKGSEFRLYVDGVSSAPYSNANFVINHYSIAYPYLGNSYQQTSGWVGNIDGFRVISGEALYFGATSFTPSETLALPTMGPVPSEENALTDFGKSLKITAAGQGLSIPYAPALRANTVDSQMTWEAWVRADEATTTGAIFSIATALAPSFEVRKAGANYVLTFTYNANNQIVTATNKVIAGQWQHVAAVLKRGTTQQITLFVDGVAQGSAVITNGALGLANNEAMFVGTNRAKQSFLGSIDEVRVTNGDRYSANFTPAAIQTDALPKFNNVKLARTTEKQAANYDVTAADFGNTGSMTYSSSVAMPTGLALSPTTGMITGTNPDATLTPFNFAITATDGKGNKQKRAYTISPVQDSAPSALKYSWRFNDRPALAQLATIAPNVGTIAQPTSMPGTLSYFDAPGRSGEYALNLKGGHAYRNNLGTSLSVLNSNSFTVEGWFRTTATYTGGLAPTFLSVSTNALRFYVNPGDGKLGFTYNGVAPAPSYTIPLNTWQHIAMVRDGAGTGSVKVYLNGAVVHTFDSATIAIDNMDFGSVANLADYLFPSDTYMRNWNIYDVAKYTAAFTPTFDNYNDPIWASATNAVASGNEGDGVSAQLIAEKAGTRSLTYSSTAIPSGITLSSTGALGGVYPEDTTSISVVATDNLGATTNARTFFIPVVQPVTVDPFALFTRNLFPMTGTDGSAPVDTKNAAAVTYYTNTGATQVAIRPAQSKWGNGSASFSSAHLNSTVQNNSGNGSHMFFNNAVGLGANDDYTVEMWFYQTVKNTNNNYLWSYYPASEGTVLSIRSGDNFLVYQVSTGTQPIVGAAVTMNTWNHVALSRENGTMRLFLNGVLQGSTPDTRSFPAGINAIGGFEFSSFREYHQFKGYINDFRLTHKKARYTTNFTPPTAAMGVEGPNGMPAKVGWTFNRPAAAASTASIRQDAGVFTAPSLSGSATFTTAGSSNALTFANGARGEGNTGSAFNFLQSSNWTYECWVNPSVALPEGYTAFTAGANSFRVYQPNVAFNFSIYFAHSTQNAFFPAKLTAGVWQHLAVVRNGTSVTCYLNGVAGPTVTISIPPANTYNNVAYTINGYPGGGPYSPAMSQADLLLYDYSKYSGNFTPPVRGSNG